MTAERAPESEFPALAAVRVAGLAAMVRPDTADAIKPFLFSALFAYVMSVVLRKALVSLLRVLFARLDDTCKL